MRISVSHLALLAVLGLPSITCAQPPSASPAAPTDVAPPIEAKAVAILKAGCDTLAAAKAMSFTATNTDEEAARNGQPLYYTTVNEVTLQRPDKLRVVTPGGGIPDVFYYDGKAMVA